MYKILLMIFMATILNANAGNYQVKFKGIKLGEIDDLSTLKSNYLQAKVTNYFAKMLIRKDYYVFYAGEEPRIKDAKFRRDKNMVLFAFYESITTKPKHKVYKINDVKTMTIDCAGNECKFVYDNGARVKGRGVVLFDKNGNFLKIKEEISTVEISKI